MGNPLDVRFGPYVLRERLGEGGMCVVFRARRDGERDDWALKLLKTDRAKDERVLDLFITEADLATLVRHPNLVAARDAGEIDGRYFLAMELLEGGNLRAFVDRCQHHRVPLPLDLALFLVSEVLQGLHALHELRTRTGVHLGLVHRDVTPENIFFSEGGRVILGDLGVAHVAAYGAFDPSQMVGKLSYLAPEMVREEDVDRHADVFAAAVITYELLTGTRLFASGTDEERIARIASVKIPKARKLSAAITPELEAVLSKALSRRPKDRFQTAEALSEALGPFWSRQIGQHMALAAFISAVWRLGGPG